MTYYIKHEDINIVEENLRLISTPNLLLIAKMFKNWKWELFSRNSESNIFHFKYKEYILLIIVYNEEFTVELSKNNIKVDIDTDIDFELIIDFIKNLYIITYNEFDMYLKLDDKAIFSRLDYRQLKCTDEKITKLWLKAFDAVENLKREILIKNRRYNKN